MASKTRLANKTIWALEDIVTRCKRARQHWQLAMQRAEKSRDPILMMALARLRDELAEIERQARDARLGRYHEGKTVDE